LWVTLVIYQEGTSEDSNSPSPQPSAHRPTT